jgi:hypothetical protein
MVADFLCEVEGLLMQLRHSNNRREMTSLKEMLTATRWKGNIIHTYSDWLQLTFDHTTELEGLASRDFECPKAMLIGNLQPAGLTPWATIGDRCSKCISFGDDVHLPIIGRFATCKGAGELYDM